MAARRERGLIKVLDFLKGIMQTKKKVKVFISEGDLYEGIISHIDNLGLVLEVEDFSAVLPFFSIYVIEV